jgi:hypothetical protein
MWPVDRLYADALGRMSQEKSFFKREVVARVVSIAMVAFSSFAGMWLLLEGIRKFSFSAITSSVRSIPHVMLACAGLKKKTIRSIKTLGQEKGRGSTFFQIGKVGMAMLFPLLGIASPQMAVGLAKKAELYKDKEIQQETLQRFYAKLPLLLLQEENPSFNFEETPSDDGGVMYIELANLVQEKQPPKIPLVAEKSNTRSIAEKPKKAANTKTPACDYLTALSVFI